MGAIFDSTGQYRYRLWREWQPDAPRVGFVMLNPSVADAETNDPTIRRCVSFARSWGFGSIEVLNLFAYRATDPRTLQQVDDPIGSENDRHLSSMGEARSETIVQRSHRLILAWGNWGTLHQRDRAVLQLLSAHPQVYCLGSNRSGQPRHPLYVKGDVVPVPLCPKLCSPGMLASPEASPDKLNAHSRSSAFT